MTHDLHEELTYKRGVHVIFIATVCQFTKLILFTTVLLRVVLNLRLSNKALRDFLTSTSTMLYSSSELVFTTKASSGFGFLCRYISSYWDEWH